MFKKMMLKVIKDTHASGRESMDMILSECLIAVNEMARHGGCAPAQWVLSRLPRHFATMGDEDECLDVGALPAHANEPTTFGVQSHYRAKAREAFVRLWRTGQTRCIAKGRTRCWFLPSWRHRLVLQRSTSR